MNKAPTQDYIPMKSGYRLVNGINMYYEIYGNGKPLVLIHGGGSTIQTNFEQVIPLLASDRQVIAMELQAHGRTEDRNADSSFEQDADDVADLLKQLQVEQADFLGFSNGGTTAIQIGIRHSNLVHSLILVSALTKRNGIPDWFWDFMLQANLAQMPIQLQEGYKRVAKDPNGLQIMHDRDAKRMVHFKDIPDEAVRALKFPCLIIIGDKDIVTPEHALELNRMIEESELAVLPGGHGTCIGEITTLSEQAKVSDFLALPLISQFLDKHS